MFENIPCHCIHINWQQNLQSNNWVCESQLVYKNMANIQLGQIFYVVDTVDCKHTSDLVSSTIKFSASGNGWQTCLQHMTFELTWLLRDFNFIANRFCLYDIKVTPGNMSIVVKENAASRCAQQMWKI